MKYGCFYFIFVEEKPIITVLFDLKVSRSTSRWHYSTATLEVKLKRLFILHCFTFYVCYFDLALIFAVNVLFAKLVCH